MPFGSTYIPKTNRLKHFVKAYVKIFGFPPYVGDRTRAYHVMKYLEPQRNEVILDAGCGNGVFSLECCIKGTNIIGVDVYRKNVQAASKVAKQASPRGKVQFLVADISNLPFKDESFDKILCVDVMEHIADDSKVFGSFSRVLRVFGSITIHVPQIEQNNIFLKELTFDDLGQGHIREGYSIKKVNALVDKSNLKIVRSVETFKFFSSLAWEINYKLSPRMVPLLFSSLYALSRLDFLSKRKGNGLLLIIKHKIC